MKLENRHDYTRVACCSPPVKVADITSNSQEILSFYKRAQKSGANIVLFPELSLSSYSCADLFFQDKFRSQISKALSELIDSSQESLLVFGFPLYHESSIYNAVMVAQNGEPLAVFVKTHLPNYSEFYEKRWFKPSDSAPKEIEVNHKIIPVGNDIILCSDIFNFSVEVCEDLWAPLPPSTQTAIEGADIILNASSSNELIGKANWRKNLISQYSGRVIAAYCYASSGPGESTTDTVYSGHSMIAEYGEILSESERFKREGEIIISDIDISFIRHERQRSSSFFTNKKICRRVSFSVETCNSDIFREVDCHPFVPSDKNRRDERCKEIFAIQSEGLAGRLAFTGIKNVVIGLSGGLDSTLALLVIVEAFKSLSLNYSGIKAITMPGFGTTNRTLTNSHKLCKELNIPIEEIDIKNICKLQLDAIKHSIDARDVTYENVQARERTEILMNKANKIGGLVIGTGDLSEMALGWSTYNGDHMSMYAVNCGVPKTLVKYLVEWVAESSAEKTKKILMDIAATPISPELLPPTKDGNIAQKTEEHVGPYELHDFFLFHAIRRGSSPEKIYTLAMKGFKNKYNDQIIEKWLKVFYKRFFSQQFKRSCIPDGPKVGTIALSPRADWRMPSDASVNEWLS